MGLPEEVPVKHAQVLQINGKSYKPWKDEDRSQNIQAAFRPEHSTSRECPIRSRLVGLSRAAYSISPRPHLYRKNQELGYSKPEHIYQSELETATNKRKSNNAPLHG